jgi:hypothetical protein
LIKAAKKIKRKQGTVSKNYFSAETDEAIILFQNAPLIEEKHKLFNDAISPALNSLVNNLIWVYGFKHPRDSVDVMKNDCIAFLYESLHKWQPGRGTKAFSYFNIVAKRWLINESIKYQKRDSRQLNIEEPEFLSISEQLEISQAEFSEAPDDVVTYEEMKFVLGKMLEGVDEACKNDREKKVVDAIKQLFDNIDDIDILNKHSALIYLREISGLDQKQLSTALSSIRKNYKDLTGGRGVLTYDFWKTK